MEDRPNRVDRVVRYLSSSPAGEQLVPDTLAELNTGGLEWFDMATCPDDSSSVGLAQAVPASPLLTASSLDVHSSPRCNFSVPSTPVQESWKLLVDPEDELTTGCSKTLSPLVQTVPVIGES